MDFNNTSHISNYLWLVWCTCGNLSWWACLLLYLHYRSEKALVNYENMGLCLYMRSFHGSLFKQVSNRRIKKDERIIKNSFSNFEFKILILLSQWIKIKYVLYFLASIMQLQLHFMRI